MARPIATIQQSIVDAKNADSNLNGLTSPSQVAIWWLWTWIIAAVMFTLETLWDTTSASLTAIAASAIPGTPAWYKMMALQWQSGDAITFDSQNRPVYVPVDISHQVVTQCAVINDGSGGIIIKVAKTVGGALVALSNAELVEFTSYLQEIGFAGVQASCQSLNADNIRVTAQIYYNGQLDEPTLLALIIANIKAYLNSIPFNGTVLTSAVELAILNTPGVNDVLITDIAQRNGIDAYVSFTRQKQTEAGYIVFDTVPPNDPDTTLTMIAQ